jgi:hypothetical protein
MTAKAFAELVNARRTGRGRWQARCPAHADHSPSFSIREGPNGQVWLHCFAGCQLDAILASLNLHRRDLFAGPLPSPAEFEAMQRAREVRDQALREARKARRDTWDSVRRWEAIVSALGAKLARTPDCPPEDDALCRTYHRACDRLHAAEIEAERWDDAQQAAAA